MKTLKVFKKLNQFIYTRNQVLIPDRYGPNSANVSPGTVENNVFNPQNGGAVEFKMEAYGRWGMLMFVSNSQTAGRDGYYNGKIAS